MRLITADQVIRQARSLIGVEYRHMGRGGKGGLDCVGLGIVVGQALDQIPLDLDKLLPPYAPHSLAQLMEVFWTYVDPIEIDDVQPGCGYLLCHSPQGEGSRKPRHLAIRSDYGVIQVNWSPTINRVTEAVIDQEVSERIVAGWKYRGLVL